jgi:2-keto-4-pentenoate hydratase/2-oxohepta-3-ene-1,7-dioic acid hydratase in catechol pathway
MKFITFDVATPAGKIRRLGALWNSGSEEMAVDLAHAGAARLQAGGGEPRYREYADFRIPQDICEFAAGGEPSLEAARDALAYLEAQGPGSEGPEGEKLAYSLSEVRMLAPVPRPVAFRDCLTFEGHKQAGARRRNTTVDPLWYEMPSSYKGNRLTIIGPGEDLKWPRYTEKLDYELEIAILIGKRGKDIPETEGLDHIFGFTVMNDFSARDIQMKEMSLWLGPHKGKDFGTAIGPCVVTRDEFDHTDAVMTARVNGEEWSRGNAGDMHFSWGRVLEHLSMEEELLPGELIGSGTVGTGCGADLDKWIQPGDVLDLEIEGIGVLSNRIMKES